MDIVSSALDVTAENKVPQHDSISVIMERSWDDLFGIDRAETEALQLDLLQQRFISQLPKLRSLRIHAENLGISHIEKLEDVVPLLFQDSFYKSYPVSLIENNRFDLLTKWLSGYTTRDLSHTDISKCDGVDSWIDALDAQAGLSILHTSGTSGKLSFFPRSGTEMDIWFEGYVKSLEGYGPEPGIRLSHPGDIRLPVIFPAPLYGRQVMQRVFRLMEKRVTPTPEALYTMGGSVSADLVSLSGRIRIAQAKGEVSKIQLTEPLRVAMRKYLAELEQRPAASADFFELTVAALQGQRVLVGSFANVLYDAAKTGLERGMRNVFAPGSVGLVGGGSKGFVLPPHWLDVIREFTGIQRWQMNYGMSEMVSLCPMGDEGWYHIPPYLIPFLLHPESGDLLPREGVVTGRFAFHDLLAQTNWGGIISGDEVTIDWDGVSPSGRKAPRIRADIERYSATITGEDKISCAATVDSTDSALQAILGL